MQEHMITVTLRDGNAVHKNFSIEDLGEDLYNMISSNLKSIEDRESLLNSLEQILCDRDEAICALYEMALGE